MHISDAVLERYRRNYGVGDDVTASHVAKHVELEASLTRSLLESLPENRWDVFSDAYTRLYQELPWLNAGEQEKPGFYSSWTRLIRKPSRIFEVGSGKAGLLKSLLCRGHTCVATEITPERGSKHLQRSDGLEWHSTDGVHLARYEPAETYDVVISTQVIEHLHPDDLLDHLSNAREILVPGGRYIFDTPHRSTGPHDLSVVLGYPTAKFMHLREYNYIELASLLRQAGFRNIRSVLSIPRLRFARESRAYLWYCMLFDWIEARLFSNSSFRRHFRRLASKLRVSGNIWLSAER